MPSPSSPRAHARVLSLVLTLALALLTGAGSALAQARGALEGRVVSASGSGVGGATVTAAPAAGGEARRARTDDGGYWRIGGLAAGRYTLSAARLGFSSAERSAEVVGGAQTRVELRIEETGVTLEALEAVSRRETERERVRFETEAGVTTRVIEGRDLKVLPGLGEADVLRAVEVLPGVVSTSDFSSAFNVRGGSADQNLILLDGFPVFNPFHLGGLFSVFNADLIARAELLAGGFGAEYGGRVSSVLNVETRTGGEDGRFRVDAGTSLLATRVAAGGPLPGALEGALGGSGGGWLVSGRRSYFDVLFAPVVDFPYHLSDLQAGLTLGTRGGGRLRFTGYWGEDVLDLSDFEVPEDPDAEPGEDDDETSILRIRWSWGNQVAGVRWEQPFGAWVTSTTLGYSRYAEALGFVEYDDTRFGSRISQATLRSEAARNFGPRVVFKGGAEATRMGYRNLGEAGGTTFFESARSGVLGGAFAQLRWQPDSAWIVEPGLRADAWTAEGKTWTEPAPRLAVKRFLGRERDAAVKVAAGRYVQFVHSLRDENLPVSNDNWVTSDENVPPVVSDQVQVGLEKFWGDRWYASVEGYWRGYRGVTDFNVADDPNDPSDDLLEGEGSSYGVDFMVRRTTGPLTGWASLSLLRAERTFPDPLAQGIDGVPDEVTFPPVFDRRVDLDVVAQYRLPGRVEAGLRFNFGTGVPYSRPVASFVGFETDVINGGYRIPRPLGDDPEVPVYVVPGQRNQERYPAYHRLDVTLRRSYRRSWGTFTPYLQVLNAYNRRNVLFYFYNYDDQPATRSGVSMFPVLPTFGVEMSF